MCRATWATASSASRVTPASAVFLSTSAATAFSTAPSQKMNCSLDAKVGLASAMNNMEGRKTYTGLLPWSGPPRHVADFSHFCVSSESPLSNDSSNLASCFSWGLFWCDDGHNCFSAEQRCDGVAHCKDETDELFCGASEFSVFSHESSHFPKCLQVLTSTTSLQRSRKPSGG
jgi:hypothetical protein